MSGHIHPLSQIIRRAVDILAEIGFEVAEGPELETEYYNFDALNVPKDHPARDMQDSLWLKPQGAGTTTQNAQKLLMRTQTSAVQIRYMESHRPPIKIVVPGKVFRNEATDATHEAQFYQLEGLQVDEKTSLADLKGTIQYFFRHLFGSDSSVRLRPSYFPFVEPGVEADISCFKCAGKGCAICKQTGWIEIMGAGMVQPSVLNGVKIDPRKYQGFAFGMGIDRIAMLYYGLDDVRLSYLGDLRFINQF